MTAIESKQLNEICQSNLTDNTLVRITLSKPKSKTVELQKILIKPALIKNDLMLSFTLRHQTKDITKNFTPEKGIEEIENYFADSFQIIHIFTTQKDYIFQKNKKGKISLRQAKPTFTIAPTLQHNKHKEHPVGKADFLVELGVTDQRGRILKDKGDKYKQINKFVEILASLSEKTDFAKENRTIQVTDMGAGKGYLTFAVYDYLVNKMQLNAEVVGVEVRPDLIDLCNRIATKIGFTGLRFEEGYIGNYELKKTDILIALHACDTATDDAIQKGIDAGAELIICAPCCHKQIRREMTESKTLASVINFGILKERQAEIVTDTIRALILEKNAYKTKVFEFISTEHTGKNLMIVGVKHNRKIDQEKIDKEIEKLKNEFGIDKHYLETLS